MNPFYPLFKILLEEQETLTFFSPEIKKPDVDFCALVFREIRRSDRSANFPRTKYFLLLLPLPP